MTATKEIRKELKSQLGYNSRQVSVSSRYYGSITFTVRDANVDLEKVKQFSYQYESIRRCEVSGDILSGGNTFVDVQVSETVEAIWAEDYIEDVAVAVALLKAGEQSVKVIEGYTLFVNDYNGMQLVKWNSNGIGQTVGNYWICNDSVKRMAIQIRNHK